MVRQKLLIVLLCVAFGLPFLVLADLFPFHRFGMFASLPRQAASYSHLEIQWKTSGNWKKMQTGNTYFDDLYIPQKALVAFGNPSLEKALVGKLKAAMPLAFDSVRWIKTEVSGKTQIRIPAQ